MSFPGAAAQPVRRVLFSESSPNLGGQELQAVQQMTALRRRGIDTKLACRPGSRICEHAVAAGHDVVAVPFRNSGDPVSLLKMWRLMRRWRPDAVVSHSGHDANICALAARLLPVRPRLLRSRTYQPGVPSAWTYNRLADKTIVPSELMRQSLLANPRVRAERIALLYPGIDFERLDATATMSPPAEFAAWRSEKPGPLLLHAAMLRQEKGHLFMLDVVARLRARFPDLRYVMAGEGELRAAIAEKIQRLALGDCAFLAGTVTPLAPLLAAADLLVMPSFYEPLGMSQSEALGLGVPVVASRVGGIPETIEHERTGVLVAAGDEDAWIGAIARALGQPQEMKAMAAAGKAFVRENFSLQANTDRLLAIMANT